MIQTIDGAMLKRMLINGANHLENNKKLVDDLNVFPVPDGDTGTNMSMTISAAARELLNIQDASVSRIAQVVSGAALRGARGNSGVILSQLFRGFLRGLDHAEQIDAVGLAAALSSATSTAYKAVMKPTEGTILTVARLTSEFALKLALETTDLREFGERVVARANEALALTPELLPVLKQAGVVDAGGKGLCIVLEGALAALKGETIEANAPVEVVTKVPKTDIDTENIKFQYCTEFIIQKKSLNYSVMSFRTAIETEGDCMLVIEDDDIVKVHIHTNHPGYVMEQALKIGDLSAIKVDNMKQQHNETLVPKAPEQPEQEFGIVAIASGDGMEQVFRDAGADRVVRGGQSMNPSTEDILEAVERISAAHVFVLPNNKNIILAAEQVNELTEKDVIVIPSKTIPQGISALLAFNPSASAEDNTKNMNEPLSLVKTGSVTFAARDSEIDGITLKKGDIMGMTEGKITCTAATPEEAAAHVLGGMMDENSAIVTVFYGQDVTAEQAGKLEHEIAEAYPKCDVMFYSGGQPLYYYILSVE